MPMSSVRERERYSAVRRTCLPRRCGRVLRRHRVRLPCHAGSLVVAAPRLFTNSTSVVTAMMGLLPLLCVTLVVHTASMATEGMLLAGTPPAHPLGCLDSVCPAGALDDFSVTALGH